ncbi:MAG: SDR family NAD(P)-dependent oxidoreductase [Pseudomonadota bacterium]
MPAISDKDHMVLTGANRGIGLELVKAAREAGARVSALCRRPDAAGDLMALADSDPAIRLYAADVSDRDQLQTVSDRIERPVTLLVCNAGQYRGRGDFEEGDYSPGAWETMLMTNVAGVFFTIKAFIPQMRMARSRDQAVRVAVISSQMASSARAPGGSYIYRASKAAATNLARNLAQDLAPEEIAVAAYHPGWVSTDMGGARAPVTPAASAAGLLQRFGMLEPETTGAFEDYQGVPLLF